jgi:hypothetical protein
MKRFQYVLALVAMVPVLASIPACSAESGDEEEGAAEEIAAADGEREGELDPGMNASGATCPSSYTVCKWSHVGNCYKNALVANKCRQSCTEYVADSSCAYHTGSQWYGGEVCTFAACNTL